MQDGTVDALRKRQVGTLLQDAGIAGEGRAMGTGVARKRLSPSQLLAIEMGTRGSDTLFVVMPREPELTRHLIAQATILQCLGGETTMSIVLQPYLQAMGVGHIPESTHILRTDFVGDIGTKLAQEIVGIFLGINRITEIHGQTSGHVVAKTSGELLYHTVSKILPTFLITVEHRIFQALQVAGRNMLHHLADVSVEMVLHVLPVHLVQLQADSLRNSRTIGHAIRRHTDTQDDPVALRHLPVERTVRLQLVGQVDDLGGIHRRQAALSETVHVHHRRATL